MKRDFIAEALAIVEGKSIMRAQREHLEALHGLLSGFMKPDDWKALHLAHEYPERTAA